MSVEVVLIDDQESWEMFDAAARRELDLSGEDFIQQWDAGEFADRLDTAIMRVSVLRPSGR